MDEFNHLNQYEANEEAKARLSKVNTDEDKKLLKNFTPDYHSRKQHFGIYWALQTEAGVNLLRELLRAHAMCYHGLVDLRNPVVVRILSRYGYDDLDDRKKNTSLTSFRTCTKTLTRTSKSLSTKLYRSVEIPAFKSPAKSTSAIAC